MWCTQVSDYETAYFGNMSAGTGVNYEYSRCAAQLCRVCRIAHACKPRTNVMATAISSVKAALRTTYGTAC